MARNSRNNSSVKRKFSTSDRDKSITNKNKKLKTAKTNKEEDSIVCKDSDKRSVANIKKSNEKKNSVKKATKESKRKSQTKNARKAVKPVVQNYQDKLSSQESSDDQLPLSELLKQNKVERKVKEKVKTKKCLSVNTTQELSNLPKPVEAKVKLSKSVGTPVRNVRGTPLKGSDGVFTSDLEGKSIIANFNENHPDKTANKDSKVMFCNEEENKRPSPTKHKKSTTESVGAKKNILIKHRGLSPVKTKLGKESNSAGKKQTEEHASMKEMLVKEVNVGERIVEDSNDDGEESDMDWEDVAEASGIFEENDMDGDTNNLPTTSNNVEVTISVPGKKKKCGKPSQEEIRKWIQRKINRVKKEGQVAAHKVHLLALLAVGLKKNEMCNNALVQAIGLSLLPVVFTQRRDLKTWDIAFLTRVTTWMKNNAPSPGEVHTGNSEATYLMRVLEKKVYLLIVILRALGLSCRLVMSLQVVSNKIEDVNKKTKPDAKKDKTPGKSKQAVQKTTSLKEPAKKRSKKNPKETLSGKLKNKSISPKNDSPSTSKSLRKKAKVDYTDETKSEYFNDGTTSSERLSGDEDDFEVPVRTLKRGRSSGSRLEVPQDAPAGGETSGMIKKGRDIWVEVYLEKEKRWICIDGEISSVNQPEECEKLATKPIKYIMAFDNECSIKDVTRRYASGWLTVTPKLRVDPEWLAETMDFYRTKNLKRDKKEDSLLKARLLQKPLPQTVSEYKNHPLYVLKRHLLKFEAIYPESAATLGFCRGEGVYARDCVHTLHTRELWLKEARVVKSGEEAYKIVKGRKSRRKMLENVGEVKSELFGRWQTEDYVPPPVVDGKVPRNEYGNVELFKPSMLPAGACHIQVPGIHRLARKLNIDAVPAVVGFDFHGGFNHPIMDGVVVGEEFKEQLLLAWDKEQEEKIERERAKREKRVVDNWTHLVRSLRIRERLKRKYSVEEDLESESKVKRDNSPEENEDMTDISLSWPLNKQEGKTARDADGHCHVFLPANNVQDPVTGEWSKVCACGLKEPLEVS